MRFSLIVATRGRTAEVAALLDSLLAQNRPDVVPREHADSVAAQRADVASQAGADFVAQGRADFEVIVVDQNGDDRLAPVLAPYESRMALRRVTSSVANACRARNLGLRLARGEIVTFPDDDCLYPPGVLNLVDAAFAADPEVALRTGPAASPAGGLGSGRWNVAGGPISLATVWTSVIEFNLFLRRDLALALGGFDEGMGPGSRFGSAEGNDLVCRAIAAGVLAVYDPQQRIIHPDKRLSEVATARAFRYGMGLGLALRRHRVPLGVWLPFMLRPIGGIVLSLARLRGHNAAYYAMTLAGRLAGFLAPEAREGQRLAPLQPA